MLKTIIQDYSYQWLIVSPNENLDVVQIISVCNGMLLSNALVWHLKYMDTIPTVKVTGDVTVTH